MSVIGATIVGTIASATPLLLAALGENVVQKSGVVNVGLEGMLLAGAFAATVATLHTGNPYVGVTCGAIAGIVTALLFGIFAVRLSANQVVVGVVINLLALGLTGTLYRKMFVSGDFVKTASLPRFFGGITILSVFALMAVPIIWWWLHRTRGGLEIRACGEQPIAAEASGVRVLRIRMLVLCVGGAMAGLAGAYLSVGDNNTFVPNMSAGRGFIALAIVTSGRWNPIGCLAAALVFGFTEALQYQGQALGLDSLYQNVLSHTHLLHTAHTLNIEKLPYQLFLALPYIATLIILTLGSRSVSAPAALGRPYRKS